MQGIHDRVIPRAFQQFRLRFIGKLLQIEGVDLGAGIGQRGTGSQTRDQLEIIGMPLIHSPLIQIGSGRDKKPARLDK